jgi:DNA ligase-1
MQLFKAFQEIAGSSGEKSQERKKGMIVKLLAAAKGNEAGYVMRALQVCAHERERACV